ncbi:sulfite exporter TauE/SafE family protein [Fontisphaera persica]|uniref:urease accessory protein UreH domain-containing protein n=1 Tax=Fontisphaera persica TaxID=2974023 RepID=UPI0024BFC76D|nr:sulfite exporter TauE/SafE family protein [Fontisphaera persica]WCJ59313.1 sulfite exporter TauE/SafE family protein [Fontisphaera persica]
MIAFVSGWLAGTLHVWSGPDHLAAIAPLATRYPHRAWLPGARWGIGHSAGVAVVGVLALLAREWLPVDAISHWGERLVGVLLMGIGLWSVHKARRLQVHAHPHAHGENQPAHEHLHVHEKGRPPASGHAHVHAAMGIGILHGLAGSSHLLGILPMLGMRTQWESALYLAAFAGGTILSMAVFSLLMGWLARRFQISSEKAYRGLMTLCGLAAFGVGLAWLFLAQGEHSH